MQYEGMVYRPPSEAYSLIIQITIGCSHNECTFCSMFKDKQFRVRKPEEIRADLTEARGYYKRVDRIFLADGDALCLATDKLMSILDLIRELFPECRRVGIYGSARDVLRKTPEELIRLKEAGLGIVYLGAESGSPQILKAINKNATREELIESVQRIEASGLRSSVTFISGIGGRALWQEHALMTASMISEMQPYYASVLTLMVEPAAPIYEDIRAGRFELLTPVEVMAEMECLLENIHVTRKCVFRSNHASNYLSLKGDLPEDRERMLAQVRAAKENTAMLKEEYFRAL
ncbi:MAG: radical SAM protein [Eubacteriales bacterium]|nr:radical SAM protein [Eubacteriales bacterium]MDD3537346.1 radical SAM protein [Eubacteriales bacterium]